VRFFFTCSVLKLLLAQISLESHSSLLLQAKLTINKKTNTPNISQSIDLQNPLANRSRLLLRNRLPRTMTKEQSTGSTPSPGPTPTFPMSLVELQERTLHYQATPLPQQRGSDGTQSSCMLPTGLASLRSRQIPLRSDASFRLYLSAVIDEAISVIDEPDGFNTPTPTPPSPWTGE
jgi:hypothetical protein